MSTEYQFTKDELEIELNKISNWTEGFDKEKLDKFMGEISKLKFTSPNKEDVFNAFKIGENNNIIQPNDVRILIIGQDPYPERGKAHGYAFSVPNEYTKNHEIDDSLLNIFIAIERYKDKIRKKNCFKTEEGYEKSIKLTNKTLTDLSKWAKNSGVLLLNAALTFEKIEGSKKQQEKLQKLHIDTWSPFFTKIIENILKSYNKGKNQLVVFLWGENAKIAFNKVLKTLEYNDVKRDILILSTTHPSKNRQSFKKGFRIASPNHFELCDKFLGEDIWKNFPENNQ